MGEDLLFSDCTGGNNHYTQLSVLTPPKGPVRFRLLYICIHGESLLTGLLGMEAVCVLVHVCAGERGKVILVGNIKVIIYSRNWFGNTGKLKQA